MANCKNCEAELPTASFGELSEYCSTCEPLQPSAPQQRLDDETPKSAGTSVSWPLATISLIAISVGVFVAMVATGVSFDSPTAGQLLSRGGNFAPFTLSGQYWRLVSSAFLHVGFVHLGLNMMSLWILGRMVEKFFGPFITFGLYLLTAIGAGLLSLSWAPMRVSAGASGSIFGFDGILISVLYYGRLGLPPDSRRRALSWVLKIALINLVYGLFGNIDNMAHLGGLLTGLLAGLFLARTFSSPAQDRVSQQTRIMAMTALGLLLVLVPVRYAKAYLVELQQGESAIQQRDINSAISHLQRYISLKPDDAHGHAALGVALHSALRLNEAVPEYQRALALQPDTPWVELALANIFTSQHKAAEAVPLYRDSLSKLKASAVDYRSYGVALSVLQNYTEAEAALQHSLGLNEKDPIAHILLAGAYDKLGRTKDAEKERQRAVELNKANNANSIERH